MAKATGGARTLLDWMLRHEPQRLDAWFSVSELFWLGWPRRRCGGPGRAARVGRAGVAGHRVPLPRHAPGSSVGALDRRARQRHRTDPDARLGLWVAAGLGARGLPAAIAGDVLQVTLRNLLDRVRAAHPDDWAAVGRYPSTLTAADFDDFVSTLTGEQWTDVTPPCDADSPLRQ